MKLFIVTTELDRSLPTLLLASKKEKIPTSVLWYPSFAFFEGEVRYKNLPLRLKEKDLLLIRWPWDPSDTKKDYTFFAKYLVDTYPEQIVLDRECLSDFSPFYEDKLFQAMIFQKLGIKSPSTWHFANKKELDMSVLPFPLVMKKRISSRGKGTYRVTSPSDLKRRVQHEQLSTIIFQKYIPFKKDLRILVYKGEVLGTVERVPHVRKNNRLVVKGGKASTFNKKNVVTDCLSYASYLGADFVGFDVLVGEDGKNYLLEANLSPQYDKFEARTGIDVSGKIIRELIS